MRVRGKYVIKCTRSVDGNRTNVAMNGELLECLSVDHLE